VLKHARDLVALVLRYGWPPVVVLALLLPGTAHGAPHVLRPLKAIGVPWREDGPHWMSFVAFSADGSMVASDGPSAGDAGGTLTEWTFPDGKLVRRLPTRPEALSPDWRYYADSHGIREAASGRQVLALPDGVFAGFAFSADSREAVEVSASAGAAIRVIDLASGRQVQAFGTQSVFAAALSPDGARVAAGYWDEVLLWDRASGQRTDALRGFGRYVVGLAYSRDGRFLAGGTDQGGLQAWDLQRHRRLWSRNIGGLQVSTPAFSPDGRLVAVGSYGTGEVSLIETRTGQLLDRVQVSGLGCGSVAFSPDGQHLITPSTGGLIRWPYDFGGTIRVFEIAPAR
jgi:WD40 repeat protein